MAARPDTLRNETVIDLRTPPGALEPADRSTDSTPPRTAALPAPLDRTADERQVGVYERWGKRPLDVAIALVLGLLLLPLGLVIALALRLTLGPGVLFRQERVGRHGTTFTLLKFRTMQACRRQAERPIDHADRRRTHKSADDPRHTPLGRLLRRTSLDELPQLVNVLKGEMSFVGPRPELPEVARRGGYLDHPRHAVRPGLTGLWQVSPDRSGPIVQGLRYDVDYSRAITFRGDLRIALRTPLAMVRGNTH